MSGQKVGDALGGSNKITKPMVDNAWKKALEAEDGDVAGKPITKEEQAAFKAAQDASRAKTKAAAKTLADIMDTKIPPLLNTGGVTPLPPPVDPSGTVVVLPPKAGHPVFLTAAAGFGTNASGTTPASSVALTQTFFDAGRWLQHAYGTPDNIFKGLPTKTLQGVAQQLFAAAKSDTPDLNGAQRTQLLGCTAALLTEFIKTVTVDPRSPDATAQQAMLDQAFAGLAVILADPTFPPAPKRALLTYLTYFPEEARSNRFLDHLSDAQKVKLYDLKAPLFPRAPFDYAKWDAINKSVIVVDKVIGPGEGFFKGHVAQLLNEGIDPNHKFKLVGATNNTESGPATMEMLVLKDDPLNKWGRDMTVRYQVRPDRSDKYNGLADPNVDVVARSGHSEFGQSTMSSLATWERKGLKQVGPKVLMEEECCTIDTKNRKGMDFADAAANSVASLSSAYFRTGTDANGNTFANDSEGFHADMVMARDLLGKKEWSAIGADLKAEANWYGHDTDNNWTVPGENRSGAALDSNNNGVPDIFDVLPCYNTTNVAESVAQEFALKIPNVPAEDIVGDRVFQASQFFNTSTNYNSLLQPLNVKRRVAVGPGEAFFDGASDPRTLVKWTQGENGFLLFQFNSALAPMTTDTMRMVVAMEWVRKMAQDHPTLFTSVAQRNAMMLLTATASIEFDGSNRDGPMFDGIKKLYGYGADVSQEDFSGAIMNAEGRHNYTGDLAAVQEVSNKYPVQLAKAGVGEPAVTATA